MRLQWIVLAVAGSLLALAVPAQACSFHDQASTDTQTQQQTAQASQPQTATQ